MIVSIILIVLLVFIFYVGSDKAKKGHDWLVVPILLFCFLAVKILGVKSCVKNSNHTPRYDYYDDRTPR